MGDQAAPERCVRSDNGTQDIIGPPLCPDGCLAGEDCADEQGGECLSPL